MTFSIQLKNKHHLNYLSKQNSIRFSFLPSSLLLTTPLMEKKIGFENSKNKIKFMTGPNPSNKKQSEHHYKQLI